ERGLGVPREAEVVRERIREHETEALTVRWDEGHAAVAPLVDRRVAQVSAGEADGSTDHELRELALGAVRRSAAAGDPSAPDHGDAIRDLEDLVELVADEDDARALRAKLPEHAEDLARLLRREDGGRLVEDEDPRVAVDRL